MFTVYLLYSKGHNKIYVGFTSDLSSRMDSHNIYSNKGHTVKYRPWTLIHSEVYGTKKEAMMREKQLKSGKGREFMAAFGCLFCLVPPANHNESIPTSGLRVVGSPDVAHASQDAD